MSRILRRPMFRGGKVSSYGTGIASGLGRPGYAPGGEVLDMREGGESIGPGTGTSDDIPYVVRW